MNTPDEDRDQEEALARWRERQRTGHCGEIATTLLAAIALGMCVLGIAMGWL